MTAWTDRSALLQSSAAVDPSAAGLLLAGAAAYVIGLRRLWHRAGRGRLVRTHEVACFALGWAAVAVALLPPIDALAAGSFTAHMVQHVLLLVVAPPLLAAGALLPTLLWALPDRARATGERAWRRVLRSHGGRRWAAWAGATLVAQTAVMWAWHAPALYEAALDNAVLHAFEHATFLGAATAFWWAVGLGPGPRRGAAVPVVFAAALPGSVLGAALTLSTDPWYPAFANLDSQQLAGVVMWAFGGLFYVLASAVLFGRWLAGTERLHPARPVGAGSGVTP